jgi:hypothetical protein
LATWITSKSGAGERCFDEWAARRFIARAGRKSSVMRTAFFRTLKLLLIFSSILPFSARAGDLALNFDSVECNDACDYEQFGSVHWVDNGDGTGYLSLTDALNGQQGAIIGDKDLLEQADEEERQTIREILQTDGGKLIKLRKQMFSAFNWSGHQLGKETDEGRKPQKVALAMHISQIEVDGVAE